jgi:hypothetical protein
MKSRRSSGQVSCAAVQVRGIPKALDETDRAVPGLSLEIFISCPEADRCKNGEHEYLQDGAPREGPFKDRKQIMKILCERAGVQYFRIHALRHAGASEMDKSNIPIGTIQRILGRETRTTTEIYLHSIGDAEREAMAVLELTGKTALQISRTNSHMGGKRLDFNGCKCLILLVSRPGIEPGTY